MTLGGVVSLAPPLEAVRERPRLSERALMRGYRPAVVRRESCACGTDLVQRAGEDVADVVTEHVRTTAHAAWSAETRVVG